MKHGNVKRLFAVRAVLPARFAALAAAAGAAAGGRFHIPAEGQPGQQGVVGAGADAFAVATVGEAAVLRLSGEMLETSMDDIELAIVQDYLQKNLKYMEA